MSKVLRFNFLFLITILITACSSRGFNRGELKEKMSSQPMEYDDQSIQETLEKRSNLKKPFSVGVFFADQAAFWRAEDKDIILKMEKELQEQGVVKKLFPLIVQTSDERRSNLKEARFMAARHGADSILWVNSIVDNEEKVNNLAWTYILLIPTFLVNGNETDTIAITQASLWDPRNEFLYLTAEAEKVIHDKHSLLSGRDHRQWNKEATQASLNNLKEELVKQFTQL